MSLDWFIVTTSASSPSITERACLLEPPCDWLTVMSSPVCCFQRALERGIDLLVELARDVVADVEQVRAGGQQGERRGDAEGQHGGGTTRAARRAGR